MSSHYDRGCIRLQEWVTSWGFFAHDPVHTDTDTQSLSFLRLKDQEWKGELRMSLGRTFIYGNFKSQWPKRTVSPCAGIFWVLHIWETNSCTRGTSALRSRSSSSSSLKPQRDRREEDLYVHTIRVDSLSWPYTSVVSLPWAVIIQLHISPKAR